MLIPAYEPGDTLVALIEGLRAADDRLGILVVDDGSGPDYAATFAAARDAGAEVIGTAQNHGKGHALKLGFAWIARHHPGDEVVSADSDGQHLVPDILRIAKQVRRNPDAIVLGGRQFTGRVPLRSRFGNAVSRGLFRAVSGVAVHDTQTGLRGYPAALLPWLQEVPGERFEYELAQLLRARDAGVRLVELPIETVYLQGNASSHFRPVIDSVRVMRPLLLFAASSFASFLLDLLAVQVLAVLTGSLAVAVFGARLISGSVNFLVNRHLVFRATEPRPRRQVIGYVALALGIVVASYLGIGALTGLGVALVPAKILVDVVLYLVSYQLQRLVVFAARAGENRPDATIALNSPRHPLALQLGKR